MLEEKHKRGGLPAAKTTLSPFVTTFIRAGPGNKGFRLFDRTTRQVELTAYGSDLLAVTQPGLGALDAAMSGIGQAAKGKSRLISVGTTPWLAANVLPPAIQEFREHRPDLRIRLFDGNLSTVARRVAAGKLELGLGLFERIRAYGGRRFFAFR